MVEGGCIKLLIIFSSLWLWTRYTCDYRDITIEAIAALLIDMATLAIKLDKALSTRLFPILNKKTGEMTTFNSPYLVDCKIFTVN